jgi:hypothetical protein
VGLAAIDPPDGIRSPTPALPRLETIREQVV